MNGDASERSPNYKLIVHLVDQLSTDLRAIKDDVSHLRRVLLGNGNADTALVFQVAATKKDVNDISREFEKEQLRLDSLEKQQNTWRGVLIGVNAFWLVAATILGFILK